MTTAAPSRPHHLRVPIIFTALLALVITLLAPLPAHAAVALKVTVVGPTGSTVSGLTVTVLNADTSAEVTAATTNSSGVLNLNLAAGDYTLRFPETSSTFAQYLGGTPHFQNAQHIPLLEANGSARVVKAALSAAGKIGGKVTTTSGKGIGGATVTVFVAKGETWAVAETATTSSSGAYTVTGLEPGDYRVQAKKGTTYAPLFAAGATSIVAASDIGVFPAKTTTTTFKLGAPAKVSGVVRADTGSGPQPLAGVTVTAWRFVGPASPSSNVEQVSATATTNSSGAYTLTGLTPGDYTLYFDAPESSSAGSTFLGGASEPQDALSFVVGSGATVTGKNVTLVEEGTISGLFRQNGSLTPIANARVSLYGSNEDPDDPLVSPRAVVFTAVDGSWSFDNVGPGDYSLVFGAFEESIPGEDIGWERRGWSTVNLSAGEHEGGNNQTSIPRVAPVPNPGDEPTLTFSGSSTGQVGGYVDASTGIWTSSGYPLTGGTRWYRDGVPIPRETDSQYALRPGDVGHSFSAEVWRFDWAKGYGEFRTGTLGPAIEGDAPTYVGLAPSIEGVREVGRTLTVNPSTWEVIDYSGDSDGADLGIVWTYTWQRSATGMGGWTDIPGAVGSGPTHLVTDLDIVNGPYLRVHYQGERYGYGDIDGFTLPVQALSGYFIPVTAPKVTATTTTWKASPGTWAPTPGTTLYTWRVYDATNSPTATAGPSTFSRAGTSGKKVTLTIRYEAPQVEAEEVEIIVQKGKAPTATGSLAVSGTPLVGVAVTAPSLTWSFAPASFSYKWQYRSGTRWRTISGATAESFTPGAGQLGRRLRVIQTAMTPGYANASKTSLANAPVTLGALTATTDAQFTQVPSAGDLAVVTPGITSPTASTVSYVWKSGPGEFGPWTTISGATGPSYQVPSSFYPGKWLQVTVTAKRAGYTSLVQVLTTDVRGKLANTGLPMVSGPSGGALGVYEVTDPGTWTPTQDTVGYQWVIRIPDGTDSVNGTGASFDTNISGAYQPLDVIVVANKTNWSEGSVRLPVKDGVFQYNDPTGLESGTAAVGVKLVGKDPNLYNAPVGAVIARQWEFESSPGVWSAIPGATSLTYTPTSTYLGSDIRLKVRSTFTRYYPSDSISPVLTVMAAPAPTPGTGPNAPSFSGAPKVGVKLTLGLGTWNVTGATYTYQWQSRPVSSDPWTDISGATTSSYTPTAARANHELQVRVTATKAGHPVGVWELQPTPITIAPGTLVATKKPVVSKSGSLLKVTAGTWNVSGTTPSYAWYRVYADSSVQALSTTNSYTLTPDDVGNKVYVEVYADKAGYAQGAAVVVGQSGPKLEPTSTITISGDRVVGQTLLMATGTVWNSALAVPAYQWLRNGVAITGATAIDYTLQPADLGKTVSLKVTATAVGYPSFSKTVTAGTIAAATAPTNLTAPALSVVGGGSPRTGKSLSTTAGTWSVTGMSYTYQWYRGDDKIAGATSSSHLLTPADVGYELSARVTASKSGYQPTAARTKIVTVLLGDAPEGSTPTISVVDGTSLKASAVSWSMPVTVTYQWQISPDGNTWTALPGGVSDTLPVSEVPTGELVRVVVSGARPGYVTGAATSAALDLP